MVYAGVDATIWEFWLSATVPWRSVHLVSAEATATPDQPNTTTAATGTATLRMRMSEILRGNGGLGAADATLPSALSGWMTEICDRGAGHAGTNPGDDHRDR